MFVTDMEHDLFIVYRLFYLLCLDFKNLEEKIIKIIYDYEYFRIIDTDIVECFKYTESVIFFFFFLNADSIPCCSESCLILIYGSRTNRQYS